MKVAVTFTLETVAELTAIEEALDLFCEMQRGRDDLTATEKRQLTAAMRLRSELQK